MAELDNFFKFHGARSPRVNIGLRISFLLSPSPAFNFKLDSSSSHQNLKVEDLSVEWDSSGGKVQDIRKEKNRTNSPMHSPARFVHKE